MKKSIIIAFILFSSIRSFAQKEPKQDIGINIAGLLIKNQATIAPSLFYKYKVGKCQLRLQLSLDANLNSKNRVFGFKSGSSASNSTIDTSINYDPGKNIRYGVILGFQKNMTFKNSDFSYFYGLDFIFMINDFSKSGTGTVISGSTIKTTSDIEVLTKNELKTYGFGMPIGITYRFGKRYYTSFEAKFIAVYQKGKDYSLTETSRIQNNLEIITRTETTTNNKGFDIGIKPVSGISVGVIF